MQTRFLQASISLNQYRTIIITMLVIAVVMAFLIMPTAVAEAGKAVSTGG